MAESGEQIKWFTDWNYIRFSWEVVSQSIEDNNSRISWKVEHVATSDGYISANSNQTGYVTVGTSSSTIKYSMAIGNNSTVLLGSGTTKYTHNADGTASLVCTVKLPIKITFSGEYIERVDMTFSIQPPQITKASQPSCITWPEHTQDVGEFGDTISIHMNRLDSSFTHTVRYQFGNLSGTIATNVGTGTTWTIPLSFMDLLPKSLSGSGTIYVDTYSGSTLVGTKYCGFTATVPASIKPTCSITLEDINNIDDIYGSPVQALSQIKVTVNATLAYSSPIASYSIQIDGKNYNTKTATTEVLRTAGDSPVTVKVVDQRGRSATASYTMKVQAYTAPSIPQLVVHRCDANGTENPQGEYVKATFDAVVTSLNSKNTATYTLRYKKSTEDDYTEYVFTAFKNIYTLSDKTHIFAADANHSYDVGLVAADRHNTTSRYTSASTAFTLINWGQDGTSMAIGKVAEKANTLEIALDVEFIGKVSGAIFDAIYPVNSIYISYSHTNPSTLFGGTWERLTDGFLWATRSTDIIGQIGGTKEVTLTVDQIPAHSHGSVYSGNASGTKNHAWLASGGSSMAYGTISTGGGQAHNNMPPYIQVSIWRRTA